MLIRNHLARERQVGEGVSPALDARANMTELPYQVERNIIGASSASASGTKRTSQPC